MSKGSRPRPFSISQEELGNRIDSIFNDKKKEAERAKKVKADSAYWKKVNAETAKRIAKAEKDQDAS